MWLRLTVASRSQGRSLTTQCQRVRVAHAASLSRRPAYRSAWRTGAWATDSACLQRPGASFTDLRFDEHQASIVSPIWTMRAAFPFDADRLDNIHFRFSAASSTPPPHCCACLAPVRRMLLRRFFRATGKNSQIQSAEKDFPQSVIITGYGDTGDFINGKAEGIAAAQHQSSGSVSWRFRFACGTAASCCGANDACPAFLIAAGREPRRTARRGSSP